jgi:2-amino-4-hydroxy-6-hydroxymethyldihydropteridine diphosphokinase
MKNTVYLSLGSSRGDRAGNLQKAITAIGQSEAKIVSVSSVYETEPWGFTMDGSFLNLALAVQTEMTPPQLLQWLLETEKKMGRVRIKEEGYSSRIIDIDILFFEDIVIDEPGITIPHPRIHERRFVLTPLHEIAARFTHPVLKRTVAELLNDCNDSCKVYKTNLIL